MASRGPTRPRVVNTCRECKRRKVRCDQRRPACRHCTAANLQCVYDADTGQRQFQFVEGHPGSSLGPEQSVLQGEIAPATAGPSSTVAISAERFQQLEERLEGLTELVQALQSTHGSEETTSTTNTSLPQSAKKTRQTSDVESEVNDADQGHLDVQPGGRTRYVSRTHFAALCDQANETEALLRGQTRYEIQIALDHDVAPQASFGGGLLSAPPAWSSTMRSSSMYFHHLPSNTESLPPRACCDALFEAFVWNFHVVVPLVHIPTFRTEYEQFWDLQASAEHHGLLAKVPLILAALFAGSVVCSDKTVDEHFGERSREDVSTYLYRQASQALRVSYFPRAPTLESLTAYILVQGVWMREEEPLTTCSFVGVAVRVAQMLGLHKDPSHFSPTISPVVAEVRRRVWWHIFNLDVLVATAAGLPPMIDSSCWDVTMVSELREDMIGTVAGMQYDTAIKTGQRLPDRAVEEGSHVSTLGIFIRGKIEEKLVARKLLDQAFGGRPMTVSDIYTIRDELEGLSQRTSALIERIPQFPLLSTYEDNEDFNQWASLLLGSMCDKNWWYMSSPLLHRAINHAWEQVLPSAEHHCRAYLEKYICLASLDRFNGFFWCWPGNHQPLHPIMALLVEVGRNPTGPHAAETRSLIDETLALCAPNGGVVGHHRDSNLMSRPLTEGGQEAWDLVKTVRARAWRKAGLDPDILPTREQVVSKAADRFAASTGIISHPHHHSSYMSTSTPFHDDHQQILGVSSVPSPNLALDWADFNTLFGDIE